MFNEKKEGEQAGGLGFEQTGPGRQPPTEQKREQQRFWLQRKGHVPAPTAPTLLASVPLCS